MTSLAHAALDQLSALLGKRCLTDPDSAQRYGVDWTKVWAPAPSAVVLPETTEEVQQIVEIANEHGLHLVPSGGRTGLSAGAVAANGELVVAFDRMNRVLDFNEYDRSVTVQPSSPSNCRNSPKRRACSTRWTSPPPAPARSAATSTPTPVASR